MVRRLIVQNPLCFSSIRSVVGLRPLATVAKDTLPSGVSTDDKLPKFESGRISDKIMELSRESITKGEPHFRVGGRQLYFPKARIILLRPNAKHTPYQAKFIVPKSFNKLDLRDYLFHLYGLRAMNVTTQLLHAKYTRANPVLPRFRGPQIKKMTVDMAEPFIWPTEPTKSENSAWDDTMIKNLKIYREEQMQVGSDSFKPGKAFGGAVGPFRPVAQPFIPRQLGRQVNNKRKRCQSKISRANELLKVEKYANA